MIHGTSKSFKSERWGAVCDKDQCSLAQGRFKIIDFDSFDEEKLDLCDKPAFVTTWCM